MRLSAKLPPVIDKSMSSRLTAPETQGKPRKSLDRVRDVLRFKHYSLRTERSYCDWIARFIRFDSFAPRSLSLSACPSDSRLPSPLGSLQGGAE
jgi:hypothetical protein